MIRTDNFMNVHVTNCRVKVVILTQYRRVRTSVIHLRGVYATCNLGTKEQFKTINYLQGSNGMHVTWGEGLLIGMT